MFSSSFRRHEPGHGLSPDEHARFQKFAFKKMRRAMGLLMFGLPMLFAVGWARDLVVLGDAAHWTLLVRLVMIIGLLILASLTWLSGFSRGAEVFGGLYALLFSVAIAVTSSIEPARLSLTHVPIMLMAIILLPFAITRRSAILTCAGLVLPMYGLLWYLHAPAALWMAYTLFFVAACVIGSTQRNAHLAASREIFRYRGRLLQRLHRDARGHATPGTGERDGWETRAHYLHRHQRDARQLLSVARLDLEPLDPGQEPLDVAAADALVRRISEVMRGCLRHGDMLARVDGRSFVLFLPGSDADTAARVVERIRRAVGEMSHASPPSISAGITQTRDREPLKEATGRAEAALHEARVRGRDRVVLA